MDANTEQGRNDRDLSSDTVSASNEGKKCRAVMSDIIMLSTCDGKKNRTCSAESREEGEFTVLIKATQDIYERWAK